jgi:ankyrin repeat protein
MGAIEDPPRPAAAAFEAVQQNDAERLRALLRRDPGCASARNEQGDSLLLVAAYTGRRDLFETILEAGAAVDIFEASALGLADRAAALADQDPSRVRAYSRDGWTPLHLASFFGHRDLARLLIERGADVDARSRSTRFARDNTPLHAAAANGQTAVAELLLEHGADCNARDGSGFTPLGLAAANHNDLLVLALLERGARVS